MEFNFDKNFKITMTALNICRAHPHIPRDKKWALQFLIIHGSFTAVCLNVISNIIYHDLKSNDFSQICKNGVLIVVYVVITIQCGVLFFHQDSLIDLFNDIKRDYEQSKHMNAVEREVLNKYVNQSIWVCKQWLVISISGTFAFVVKSILLMIYYYFIGEFRLVAFHELVYPSIIEENKDSFFIYLLTYASLCLYGMYASCMYLAFVPLGPIFMLHTCGQLELVENQINDLFVVCDAEVIKTKLKRIIEKLQYIYSFVQRIQNIFMIAYEVTMKASTIMLPISSYEALQALNRGEISVELFTFIIGGTLISSSPCYYSDLLMEKGEMVRQALYCCDWERYYDRRTRTTLQLILQNALRPIAIRTIFRTLCLDAVTDLFQQSYAIFSLMNAVWG